MTEETIQGRKLFKGGNYMRKYGIHFEISWPLRTPLPKWELHIPFARMGGGRNSNLDVQIVNSKIEIDIFFSFYTHDLKKPGAHPLPPPLLWVSNTTRNDYSDSNSFSKYYVLAGIKIRIYANLHIWFKGVFGSFFGIGTIVDGFIDIILVNGAWQNLDWLESFTLWHIFCNFGTLWYLLARSCLFRIFGNYFT